MSALGQKLTHAAQQRGSLFDHLVGAILYRLRHGNAERVRSLEVEEQLDFACLLHRQVGGFLALENTADVPASEAIGIWDAAYAGIEPAIQKKEGLQPFGMRWLALPPIATSIAFFGMSAMGHKRQGHSDPRGA
jgi:hypothetical protein